MEQDTSSDTAPTRITLNQVCRSHQHRHRCNSREGREAGNWGWQPRARELAGMRGTEGRELGVSTSWGHGTGNDKASLTEGMGALLKEAHGPRALGPEVSTWHRGEAPRPPQREEQAYRQTGPNDGAGHTDAVRTFGMQLTRQQ
jgi:hypothetical protein